LNYLLDTNIVIFFFKGNQKVLDEIDKVGINHCFISEITLAELKYGAAFSQNPPKHIAQVKKLLQYVTVIPITAAIDLFATEKARLRNAGQLIDDFDLLIGATALAHQMTLVTNNWKHFKRLDNIALEDWSNFS